MAEITMSGPCIITARLMPGVRVGDAFISIEYAKYSRRKTERGRARYRWYIDLPGGKEYTDDDLQSGAGRASLQSGLENLLGFLSACGESYGHKMRNPDSDPENLDLFPSEVAEWAYQNSDELSMLVCELEEHPDEFIEE